MKRPFKSRKSRRSACGGGGETCIPAGLAAPRASRGFARGERRAPRRGHTSSNTTQFPDIHHWFRPSAEPFASWSASAADAACFIRARNRDPVR